MASMTSSTPSSSFGSSLISRRGARCHQPDFCRAAHGSGNGGSLPPSHVGAFVGGEPTPDALVLVGRQGILKARLADYTVGAETSSSKDLGLQLAALSRWKKELRVLVETVRT
jgi:hypothetical protein